ncbi:carbonate dehydratase [Rhizobium sullae]|nr:carbonate dehydratase [Rhizobium sullae]PKA44126.1 carbonate dehydratase [Rhizobium sullae]
MIRRNPRGDWPEVAESAYVDPTAIICGLVIIEDDVFVGPYAVIRADETDEAGNLEPICIRKGTNIQDGVVIHSKSGEAVTIGSHSSIAHRSIIHGPCTIGDDVFVGFNSVLFNCTVGNGAAIRHNSVVEGCHLPAGFHVPSTTTVHSDSDLATIPQVTIDVTAFSEHVARTNVGHARAYRKLRNDF